MKIFLKMLHYLQQLSLIKTLPAYFYSSFTFLRYITYYLFHVAIKKIVFI